MDPSLVRVSKFLSLVLRHRPESVGLALDSSGWVDVPALLAAAQRAGVPLDEPLLERVVRTSDKQRFALSPDGRRIRANQGHSVPVDLALPPAEPPEVLYHGTATRFLEAIRVEGLRPRGRTHVHLSADPGTAVAVGRRHGTPIVLRVAAGAMCRAGHEFVRAENGVWLTSGVPADYLTESADGA
jgi:putative RNA 2'-phosphotransferase